jgi:hypothetical protein
VKGGVGPGDWAEKFYRSNGEVVYLFWSATGISVRCALGVAV